MKSNGVPFTMVKYQLNASRGAERISILTRNSAIGRNTTRLISHDEEVTLIEVPLHAQQWRKIRYMDAKPSICASEIHHISKALVNCTKYGQKNKVTL